MTDKRGPVSVHIGTHTTRLPRGRKLLVLVGHTLLKFTGDSRLAPAPAYITHPPKVKRSNGELQAEGRRNCYRGIPETGIRRAAGPGRCAPQPETDSWVALPPARFAGDGSVRVLGNTLSPLKAKSCRAAPRRSPSPGAPRTGVPPCHR